MTPTPPRYVVVEGVIGVGKTTLVNQLAERLNARRVLEIFEENPFLESFYREPRRFAFPTEMFFLLSRYGQQETFAQEDLLQQHAVSDYLFEKCRVFAGLTLDEAELRLFDRMYEILVRSVPAPDVVVYLHAPIDVVVARIEARARAYESAIDPGYLQQLDHRYRELLANYSAAAVVYVDTTHIDFRDSAAVDRLWSSLSAGAAAGTVRHLS